MKRRIKTAIIRKAIKKTAIIGKAKKIALSLDIPKDVFKPSFMTAELLRGLAMIDNLDKNAKILDLGTGCGIVALALYSDGYRNIYVSDVYEKAIETAEKNFNAHDFRPTGVYLGDMFQGINDKFDLILTNPPAFPYNPLLTLNEGIDAAVFSGYDGRKFIENFLTSVKDHLNPGGRFLMTAPSFLDWPWIEEKLRDHSFYYKELVSDICKLPTYGYSPALFEKNFKEKFNSGYYPDGNTGHQHYWSNLSDKKIEYRVKTR